MQEIVAHTDGCDRVIGKTLTGEIFGEIGVLYGRPQPFTFRTTEVSQLLRLNRTALMDSLKVNSEDEHIIMNNLFQVKLASNHFICISIHFTTHS